MLLQTNITLGKLSGIILIEIMNQNKISYIILRDMETGMNLAQVSSCTLQSWYW